MSMSISGKAAFAACLTFAVMSLACDQGANTTVTTTNRISNTTTNSNITNSNTNAVGGSVIDTREPERYQATVKLTFEATGDQQNTALPPLVANVARNAADRYMEFNMPNNEKVIYLETGGKNYVVLPNRKQYAELTQETLGFEVRSVMMPENIVTQLKSVQGIQRVGEETVNGRTAVKYAYSAATDTQTQAGKINTDSYFLVDKDTGLPLRSETVSKTQDGTNVQGYKGAKLVTEMTDIKTDPDPKMFALPTDYAKIDPEQVKAQVNVLFQAAAAIVGQMVKQAQPAATTSPSPAATR